MNTSMERLLAAVNGTPADRIPVFCNLLDQGAKELGIRLEEYYASGEHVAEAQLRMLRKYGHDNVWSLFYVGREAEILGCKKILFATEGPPNVMDFVISSPADVDALHVPESIEDHPAFTEQARCFAILRNEIGGTVPICSYVSSSMTIPAMLMGMERWLELLLMGPEDKRDLLIAKCHDFFIKEVRACRAAGADIIIYSNPFGSTDFVPMNIFTSLSLPWIIRDIQAIGTEGVVYYCGMARMNDVIETVRERTGLGAYYVSPLDDLAEAKQTIGNRALTCGVINDIRLIEWSPAEIRQEVKRMLQTGMPGGRFLFGTGVMPYCIPEANIRTMLDAAYEYGQWLR
jgi:uroporphyrinogen-III decarboxylase